MNDGKAPNSIYQVWTLAKPTGLPALPQRPFTRGNWDMVCLSLASRCRSDLTRFRSRQKPDQNLTNVIQHQRIF
jgi:hypothetical protein